MYVREGGRRGIKKISFVMEKKTTMMSQESKAIWSRLSALCTAPAEVKGMAPASTIA